MKKSEKTEDILTRTELKENPFGVPAQYFQLVQEEVMQKIKGENIAPQPQMEPAPALSFLTVLKPALSLAAVFAFIFGIGYGAMSLTGTLERSQQEQIQMASEQNINIPAGTELTEEEIISIIGDHIDEYLSGEQDTVTINSTLDDEMIEQYLIDTRTNYTVLASLDY